MNGMLTDSALGIYDNGQFTELETHYCDGCGDYIDDEVFEYDGDIYCGIRCLTQNTDIRYGNVYEFK